MGKMFYDVHFHALNLSHPNILAFVRKLNWQLLALATPLLATPVTLLARESLGRVLNLLTVMENDTGSFFMLVEHYLRGDPLTRGLLDGDGLLVGGERYAGIVLTPLMMDFGFKNICSRTYYRLPPQKPIVSQVEDLFTGIRAYREGELHAESRDDRTTAWIVPRISPPLFEIYPFLGLNTRNYDLADLKRLLAKYFGAYEGRYADFRKNLGTFQGNIGDLGSHCFAGIKLYPPIGFNPWPAADGRGGEREKVEHLYGFCCDHGIPVTVHCSDGGFELAEDPHGLTDPGNWAAVLAQKPFATLKLNFAHFGKQSRRRYLLLSRTAWRQRILALLREYPRLYTDFSYVGLAEEDYRMLAEHCRTSPWLGERLLFGSDFMISLLSLESYNACLGGFAGTPAFNDAQKGALCHANPERFLWEDPPSP